MAREHYEQLRWIFHDRRVTAEDRRVSKGVRLWVITQAGDQCEKCGSRQDLEVDHITPRSWGGRDDLDNLRCLCRPCNRRKSNLWIGNAPKRDAA